MLYFLGTTPEGATGRPTLLLLLPPCAWWKWRYSCILWILFELLGGLTCLLSFYFYFLVLAIQTLQLRPNKGEMFWPSGHHQCFGRPFCVWGHFSWIVIEVLGVGFEHVSFLRYKLWPFVCWGGGWVHHGWWVCKGGWGRRSRLTRSTLAGPLNGLSTSLPFFFLFGRTSHTNTYSSTPTCGHLSFAHTYIPNTPNTDELFTYWGEWVHIAHLPS